MTSRDAHLQLLTGAFDTVRRGEDGPYLAENILDALLPPAGSVVLDPNEVRALGELLALGDLQVVATGLRERGIGDAQNGGQG